MMYDLNYVLCEVAIVSQLSYPILVHYMGLCEDDPSCDKTTMRLCLQVVPRHVGDIAASWALHLPRGPHVDPLHLFLHPHTSSSSQKNHHPAQARVLAHFAAIFDLLAQSSIHKTALGDCSLVCDSSNGPISFCSSALLIANFCCLGEPVLELACQIYVVPSNFNA